MSKTEKIIELKELLDSGLISSDDFERLKKQIFEEPEKVSFEIKKIKQVDILDNARQKRNIFYDSIKKCTKCGSDNKLENQICSVCKSDFPIVESKTEQKNYIENKKSDYKFYIFGILGFVLLFFGVSYFINNHNDKEQKESEVPTAFDSISVEPVPTVSVEENYKIEIENETKATEDINILENEDNNYLLNKDDSELNQIELNVKSLLVFQIADKELNIIYKKIMSDSNISEDRKNVLRKEQRNWLKETHRICNQESNEFRDSTMYNQLHNNCLTEKTKSRIEELKLIYNN